METNLSFWDHLDQLRTTIIKIICVAVITGIIAFFFKDELFGLLLAPRTSGFITYRLLEAPMFLGGNISARHVRGIARQHWIGRTVHYTRQDSHVHGFAVLLALQCQIGRAHV